MTTKNNSGFREMRRKSMKGSRPIRKAHKERKSWSVAYELEKEGIA